MKKGVLVGVACLSMCAVLGGVVQHSQLDAKAAKGVESQAVKSKEIGNNVTIEDINVPLSISLKESLRSDGCVREELTVKNEGNKDVVLIDPVFSYELDGEEIRNSAKDDRRYGVTIILPNESKTFINIEPQDDTFGKIKNVRLLEYKTIYNGKYYTVDNYKCDKYEYITAMSVCEKVEFDEKDILDISFNNKFGYNEYGSECAKIKIKNNSDEEIWYTDVTLNVYNKKGKLVGTDKVSSRSESGEIIKAGESINVDLTTSYWVNLENIRDIGRIEVAGYIYSTEEYDKQLNNTFFIRCLEKRALGCTYVTNVKSDRYITFLY